MYNTTVTFRTNKKLKEEAVQIFRESGISLSEAINSFLIRTVENGRMYVEMNRDGDFTHTYPKGFFELFGTDTDPSMPIPDRTVEMGVVEDI